MHSLVVEVGCWRGKGGPARSRRPNFHADLCSCPSRRCPARRVATTFLLLLYHPLPPPASTLPLTLLAMARIVTESEADFSARLDQSLASLSACRSSYWQGSSFHKAQLHSSYKYSAAAYATGGVEPGSASRMAASAAATQAARGSALTTALSAHMPLKHAERLTAVLKGCSQDALQLPMDVTVDLASAIQQLRTI